MALITSVGDIMRESDGDLGKLDLQSYYPTDLKIERIKETKKEITITLKSMKGSHVCQECGREMRIYHSTYVRTVQDLPIFQKSVILKIKAYEYNCINTECSVSTFAEDYEGFVGKSNRMTNRLEDFMRTLAFETNCEGAAVICKKLGIKISGDTIIRSLRKLSEQTITPSSDTIGVDDFAYTKGQSYCTIICDGGTHTPIDILEGRDGNALKNWLKSNKQIKKVTRDRAGAYAKAISEVLPSAMQIADRFHLHQNLLTAIKEALRVEIPNRIEIPNDFNQQQVQEVESKPDKKTELEGL
jgi:transposase